MFDIVARDAAGALRQRQGHGRHREERIPAASDVPTMAEQGVPDFVSGTWAGIIAPAGTPKEIVDRISAEARKHSPIPQ